MALRDFLFDRSLVWHLVGVNQRLKPCLGLLPCPGSWCRAWVLATVSGRIHALDDL